MSQLTIFSAPKPFTDPHIATIQRNAIQSWIQLVSEANVLLVGEEDGTADVAADYGVQLLSDVACNDEGTPLVSSIFSLARQARNNPFLLYTNADMLLLPDVLEATKLVSDQAQKFLIIGQRWDLEVNNPLDFSPGWDLRLLEKIRSQAELHPPAGSDYFIFPRSCFIEMPDFAIGRAGWDNWMIYHARQMGWVVADGTPSIKVIHQNHDYSHLPDGKPHYDLAESRKNAEMAGGSANLYMVLDSNKQLLNSKLQAPDLTLTRILRRGEVWLTPPDGKRRGWRWSLARHLRRTRRRLSGSLT
ncbi:hypothetical protein ACFLUC_01785 [Chloroflexota bacterium]